MNRRENERISEQFGLPSGDRRFSLHPLGGKGLRSDGVKNRGAFHLSKGVTGTTICRVGPLKASRMTFTVLISSSVSGACLRSRLPLNDPGLGGYDIIPGARGSSGKVGGRQGDGGRQVTLPGWQTVSQKNEGR